MAGDMRKCEYKLLEIGFQVFKLKKDGIQQCRTKACLATKLPVSSAKSGEDW